MTSPDGRDRAGVPSGDDVLPGIVYVVVEDGRPTETFVRREIAAGRGAGTTITVLSLRPPVGGPAPGVLHLGGGALVRRLAAAVRRRPGRVAHVFGRILVRARPSTLLPHLYAAVVGVAASEVLPDASFVHAHFAWVSATAADALATVRGVPLGVMPHAYDIFEDRVTDRYLGDKLRRAALVVVESNAAGRHVHEHFGVEATVVPMGVPASLVVEAVERPGHDSGLVVSVGTLKEKKGHDLLLRALADLPGVPAVVIGEGEERHRLVELARLLGVDDRVEFRGAVPEEQVWTWLDRAGVFVLASRIARGGDRDGIPNVLIEAMARGVPVVSTAVSGIPELLEDGRGVVVPPERPDLLASAVGDLFSDPDRRLKMAAQARAHVLERYTVEENWRRLAGLIWSAIAAHRG